MSELQRTRIVAAAVDTLAELGYNGITVTQLARRAGVSRKTFYEHFEDREGCFVAALEDPAADTSGSNGAARRTDASGELLSRDPANGLGGRVTYRTLRVLAAIAELTGEESRGPSNRQIAERAGISDEAQISRLLARLQSLGVVERVGATPGRGEANAWRLTDWGVAVRGAVEKSGQASGG
jgi:AcrR family transcriptional regulator